MHACGDLLAAATEAMYKGSEDAPPLAKEGRSGAVAPIQDVESTPMMGFCRKSIS